MKQIFLTVLVFATALIFAACGNHSHNEHSHEHNGHSHSNEQAIIHNITKYTDSVEVFVQYEALTAGHKSHFTIYITCLNNFKPIENKSIDVSFVVAGKTVKQKVDPLHRGIYEFSVEPQSYGKAVLSFSVDCSGRKEILSLDLNVSEHCTHDNHSHTHADALENKHHDAVNTLNFLKEQSWKIDFSTAPVVQNSFNGAVKVAAKVFVTPENTTTLVAATAGRVQYIGNLAEGKTVGMGETLLVLEGGDVTENDAAVKYAEAESNYLMAKSNYERKLSLFRERIVSESEYLQSHTDYRQAEAHYNSMKRNFAGGKMSLKSPFGGYVSKLLVENGNYVAPGTPLVEIERVGSKNIVAELPMRFTHLLSNIVNVNIELSDGSIYSLDEVEGRVTAVGRSANACNMLPITVTVNNLSQLLPGSIVTLYISSSLSGEKKCVAVPRSALVEEMGDFFVFVQKTPVLFEKRLVKTGATDGLYTQIVSGLDVGERIVVKGAVSLKLSQGAATLDPHAGHVH